MKDKIKGINTICTHVGEIKDEHDETFKGLIDLFLFKIKLDNFRISLS